MFELHQGDCLEVLRTLADASVDAVVTDPPAGIAFMGKAWDKNKGGRAEWIAWLAERLVECLRVAKPGAHLLCWGLPRTSHWTGMAIEDAGWLIEDRIAHHFGTGFPKGKAKLKPATEDWWLATKPGGAKFLNVKGCQVGTNAGWSYPNGRGGSEPHHMQRGQRNGIADKPCQATSGRWPTNLVLSHSPDCNGECVEGCPVREMGKQSARIHSAGSAKQADDWTHGFGEYNASAYEIGKDRRPHRFGDSGTAARFFPTFIYQAKATKADRGDGNGHPTVKATPLMQWLCRLVTQPGGVILDPFAGSGSTGNAAIAEGFGFIGIEQDGEYLDIAEARMHSQRLPLFDPEVKRI